MIFLMWPKSSAMSRSSRGNTSQEMATRAAPRVAVNETALAGVAQLAVTGVELRVDDDLLHVGMTRVSIPRHEGHEEDTKSTKGYEEHEGLGTFATFVFHSYRSAFIGSMREARRAGR